MDLTIIAPNLKNKNILKKLKTNLTEDDELITINISSKVIKNVLNKKIRNSKNENVLLINPNDQLTGVRNFLNFFRNEGTIVSNLKSNGQTSSKTSIKIDKNNIIETDNSLIRNIITYIRSLINKNNITLNKNVTRNGITKINSNKKQIASVIDDKPEIDSSSDEEPINPVGEKINNWKPKILFICDVKGWAWWIKSHYIKKYISDEFDIDIINTIGEGRKSIDYNKYDLYFTYGYSFIRNIAKVKTNQKITGVTAHRDIQKISRQLKQAKYIHANSMLLYNEYKHLKKNNIFYVPNGVDEQMFYPKTPSTLMQRDKINIGHVGKLSKMKGQKEIIEPVIKKLKKRGNKINYIPHYNNYRNKIPHQKMPDIYQNFDLLIIASIEDGTPASLLEGMACGIPVIGNRIGNIPEVIHTSGYNGYMINDRTNINEYVRIIEKLTKEHILEMGKNARQTIINGWTWKIQAERYRNMFRHVIGNEW